MPNSAKSQNNHTFVQKVWIVGLIFSLIAILLLIFNATFNILILVLVGTLIASYFRGLSALIKKKTKWNSTLTLSISILATTLIVLGVIYLVGATISSESAQINKKLPELVETVQTHLEKSTVGKEIIHRVKNITSSDKFTKFASQFFLGTFGGIGTLYLIILISVFFTLAPNSYLNGIVQLVPPKNRKKANDLLSHLGSGLQKWLVGKFIAMFVVFALTAIGLVILDIPMWLTLSIIAGLLNFIPNFGPLVAMIPATLIAFSISPTMAVIVICLYLVVQIIESSFVTPQAQKRLISIPPALIVLAQVFIGFMTGIWGVIFATPLVLIIIITVQDLYVNPMNKKFEKGKAS